MIDQGADAFYEETDPALARDAFPAQLKLMEGLLKNDPENVKLKLLLAEGFGGYAFLFLEETEAERAKAAYLRGRDYALASLTPPLNGLAAMPLDKAAEAIESAGPGDVPGLFWAGYGWGGWINLSKDNPDAVAELPTVVAIMERVNELSPGYQFSGASLFLGSYEALRPKMLGGDPAQSLANFESAIKATGGEFLMAKVLCAQYYAVATQDAELFKRLLGEVLEAQPKLPKARLANAVAKQRARRLLEKTDDLF